MRGTAAKEHRWASAQRLLFASLNTIFKRTHIECENTCFGSRDLDYYGLNCSSDDNIRHNEQAVYVSEFCQYSVALTSFT